MQVLRRHTRRLLIALPVAVLFVVIVGISVTADAPPPGTGIDGLLPPPNIQNGNQPTFAEKYPAASYRVHIDAGPGAIANALTNPNDEIGTIIGNLIAAIFTNIFVSLGVLATRFVEWMFTFDLVAALGGVVDSVVGSLAGTIYNGLIASMIVLVGGWMAWQLVKRRYTLVYEAAIWAFLALVVAAVYFKSPSQFVGGLNSVTTAAAQQVLAAVDSNDPALTGRGGDPTVSQGPPSDAAVRVFVNRYWQTFVVLPWSVEQFGNPQDGQRYGEEWLKKENGQPNNFDSQFASAPQFTQDWYNGKYPIDRIAVAVFACLVSFLAVLLLIPAAGMMLMAQVAQEALSMVAPLFLLIGVLVGYGQRLMQRWVGLILGASLIRVFVAAFLAVMMVIIGAASVNTKLAYVLTASIDVALLVLFFMLRRPFMAVFGQAVHPEFGGSHYSGNSADRFSHRGLGAAHDALQARLSGATGEPSMALEAGTAVAALEAGAKSPALEAVLGAKKGSDSRAAATATAAVGAAVAGGEAAAAGAGPWGLAALAALRTGQKGVRAARAVRHATQSTAEPFVFNGQGKPPRLLFRDAQAADLPPRSNGSRAPIAEPEAEEPPQLAGNGYRPALAEGAVPAGPRTVPPPALPPSEPEQRAKQRWVSLAHEGEDWNLYYSHGGELPMSKFPSRKEALRWADHEGWPVIEEPLPSKPERPYETDEVIDV